MAAQITQVIPSLGTPPTTADPATFDARADALLGTALPAMVTAENVFRTQANALSTEVSAKAVAAAADAATASAAATAADATANATLWVSAGSYTAGQNRYSPINYLTYRAITTHSGETTDPSLDATNWTALTASAGSTLGTPVATTSGTTFDFTGIPSGTKKINIMFNEVSTTGNASYLLQIGDSGGIENTLYTGAGAAGASGAINGEAFILTPSTRAAQKTSGMVQLLLENSSTNAWVLTGALSTAVATGGFVAVSAGRKLLSAELDRVRLINASFGTDTFDNGEINISYE